MGFFGFGNAAETIGQVVKPRPHKYTAFLPYMSYDPQSGEYLNSDDSAGMLWECLPTAFANGDTADALKDLLACGLPAGTILQFILHADPCCDERLEAFAKRRIRREENIARSTEGFLAFLKERSEGDMTVRDFRLFVAVKIPGEIENRAEVYAKVREGLEKAYCLPQEMGPEKLIDWLQRIFNDQPIRLGYDETVPISRQIIFPGTKVKHDPKANAMRFGSRYFRCCSVKNYPKKVDFLQTNELFGGLWGTIDDSDQMITPFLFSLNIFYDDVKSEPGDWSFFKQKADETPDSIEAFVRIIPTIWVWSNDPKIAVESVERTKLLWESQGYVMQEDREILPILYITSLPFGLYTKGDIVNKLSRHFVMPTDMVASLLPVQADFAGGGEPVLLFTGRKGGLVPIDLFGEGAANHNLLIVQPPGSGGPPLTNYINLNYYAAGALIRVVHAGGPYNKAAELFKGRCIRIDDNSPISLNPFNYIEYPERDLRAVSSVVEAMYLSAEGQFPAGFEEPARMLIQSAVFWAYEVKGAGAEIDMVHRYLATFPKEELSEETFQPQIIQLARHLARTLEYFTSEGTYGRWFTGASDLNIENDEYVVFDLEALRDRPNAGLYRVVTLQLMDFITKNLYLSSRAGRRCLITIDDLWQQGDASAALLMEESFLRARMNEAGIVITTLSVMDMPRLGPVGEIILHNTDFKFLLQSPEAELDEACRQGVLEAGKFELALMKSVRTNRSKYIEIYMQTPWGDGVSRLSVDPLTHSLCSVETEQQISNPEDQQEAV